MSFVGATNVGSIHVPDFPFQTNNSLFKDDPSKFREVDGGAKDYEKGQELGFFRLGSSVVLVFDAPAGFEFCIKETEKVKLAIPLGRTS
jgi:phosphatidylserine decarboxylase